MDTAKSEVSSVSYNAKSKLGGVLDATELCRVKDTTKSKPSCVVNTIKSGFAMFSTPLSQTNQNLHKTEQFS